jgi:glycosyltransferase involved in cell wall biosynthesis
MSRRPIGYVMEQTMGSVTHYLNLRQAALTTGDGSQRWIPIPYQPGRLHWTLRGSWLVRQTLKPIIDDLDGVFIHSMTIALASLDLFVRKPIVISGDGTPIAKQEMRMAYGHPSRGTITELVKREFYRQTFGRAAGFVAWSNWTKQSLIRDYGCGETDVAVIPPGIDLELFGPGDRDHALPRILFVGGDFVRKGGDLLVEVFRKHLRGRAELVLVTRDQVPEEPGVSVHRHVRANSDELRHLYATSDVFALPTRADCYSLGCEEALASGLPVVTTRVGGIPDLVREGKTGHLVPVDDEAALKAALLSLAMDRGKREEMSRAARADAAQRFDARETTRALFEFVRSRC